MVTPTPALASEPSTCSHCDGSGYVLAVSPCSTCNSTGKVGDKVCEVCKGSRYVSSLVDCPLCDAGVVAPVETSPATVTMQDGSLDPVVARLDDIQWLGIAGVSLVAAVLGSIAFLHFWVDLSHA